MKIAKSVNKLGAKLAYNIFAEIKKLEKQGKKIILSFLTASLFGCNMLL